MRTWRLVKVKWLALQLSGTGNQAARMDTRTFPSNHCIFLANTMYVYIYMFRYIYTSWIYLENKLGKLFLMDPKYLQKGF